MNKEKIISLAVFLIISFSVAAFGSMFTWASLSDWYITLKKPSFNPPGWVFGPVWTFLYITIAISGWIIWNKKETNVKSIIIIFSIQILLNGLWSPIFFGMKKPELAFYEICFLLISIIAYIILSWPVSKKSSLLFIPYFIWVSFATVLNYNIWQLNK